MYFGVRAILCLVLSFLNTFLVCIGPANAQVLCIGEGHVAIESAEARAACCAPAMPAGALKTPGMGSIATGSSCIDILVVTDARVPQARPAAGLMPLHLLPLFSVQLVTAFLVEPEPQLFPFGSFSPLPSAQTASLRTVVLLI